MCHSGWRNDVLSFNFSTPGIYLQDLTYRYNDYGTVEYWVIELCTRYDSPGFFLPREGTEGTAGGEFGRLKDIIAITIMTIMIIAMLDLIKGGTSGGVAHCSIIWNSTVPIAEQENMHPRQV